MQVVRIPLLKYLVGIVDDLLFDVCTYSALWLTRSVEKMKRTSPKRWLIRSAKHWLIRLLIGLGLGRARFIF